MNRQQNFGISEQMKASKHRLNDARSLLNDGRWHGAMYVAGYSIECLLKAKLMQMHNCRHLRQLEEVLQRRGILAYNATVFTHHLEMLMRLAQGLDRIRQNPTVWPYFNTANRWVPAWRYSAELSDARTANDFLEAVEKVLDWIEHNL